MRLALCWPQVCVNLPLINLCGLAAKGRESDVLETVQALRIVRKNLLDRALAQIASALQTSNQLVFSERIPVGKVRSSN